MILRKLCAAIMVFMFAFMPVLPAASIAMAEELPVTDEPAPVEEVKKEEVKVEVTDPVVETDLETEEVEEGLQEDEEAGETGEEGEEMQLKSANFAAPASLNASPAFFPLTVDLQCPAEESDELTWLVYNENEAEITFVWNNFLFDGASETIAPGETKEIITERRSPDVLNRIRVTSVQTHQTTLKKYASSIGNCIEVEVPVDTTGPDAPIHLSKANGAVITTAEGDKLDWTDVTDPSMPVTYEYEASYSDETEGDGSFSSPLFAPIPVDVSEIATPNTPEGVYYWHVRAIDGLGNAGAWTTAWMITVDNTPDTTDPDAAPVVIINSPASGTASGTIAINATITDSDLAGYHLRVVKMPEANYGHVCGEALGDAANQGYDKCGYAYNQLTMTNVSVVNGVIASIDTTQLADGTYEVILGAGDAAGHRTAADYLNDPKITIVVDNSTPEEPEEPTTSTTTITVSPANMQGWVYAVEGGTATGTLVVGPGTVPMGRGSAQFTTVESADAELLYSPTFMGTKLSDIEQLKYSTYRVSGGDALAVALQFNIDVNATDETTGWQGRLVYEAYYTKDVVDAEWQTWDTLDSENNGNWWFTGSPQKNVCSIANPCTWNEVKAAFPNASIHPTLGAVNFKAGSGWAGGFVGNVDAFTITVDGATTIVNFEGADEVVENPDTDNDDNDNNSNRRSSRRRGASNNGSVLGVTFGEGGQVLGASFCAASINVYIKEGMNNDAAEVTKLQNFLNTEMNSGLVVNGVYGEATEAAVNAFQLKYADKILAPWGINLPTGYAYKLTTWWANSILCGAENAPAMPMIP